MSMIISHKINISFLYREERLYREIAVMLDLSKGSFADLR